MDVDVDSRTFITTNFFTTASLIASFAWPIALVISLWIFKDPVSRLIDRFKKLRGLGIEVDISEKLDVAEKVAGINAANEQHSSSHNETSGTQSDVDSDEDDSEEGVSEKDHDLARKAINDLIIKNRATEFFSNQYSVETMLMRIETYKNRNGLSPTTPPSELVSQYSKFLSTIRDLCATANIINLNASSPVDLPPVQALLDKKVLNTSQAQQILMVSDIWMAFMRRDLDSESFSQYLRFSNILVATTAMLESLINTRTSNEPLTIPHTTAPH